MCAPRLHTGAADLHRAHAEPAADRQHRAQAAAPSPPGRAGQRSAADVEKAHKSRRIARRSRSSLRRRGASAARPARRVHAAFCNPLRPPPPRRLSPAAPLQRAQPPSSFRPKRRMFD